MRDGPNRPPVCHRTLRPRAGPDHDSQIARRGNANRGGHRAGRDHGFGAPRRRRQHVRRRPDGVRCRNRNAEHHSAARVPRAGRAARRRDARRHGGMEGDQFDSRRHPRAWSDDARRVRPRSRVEGARAARNRCCRSSAAPLPKASSSCGRGCTATACACCRRSRCPKRCSAKDSTCSGARSSSFSTTRALRRELERRRRHRSPQRPCADANDARAAVGRSGAGRAHRRGGRLCRSPARRRRCHEADRSRRAYADSGIQRRARTYLEDRPPADDDARSATGRRALPRWWMPSRGSPSRCRPSDGCWGAATTKRCSRSAVRRHVTTWIACRRTAPSS